MMDDASKVATEAARHNAVADGSREKPYATAVAFPGEVREAIYARPAELQREILRQANRLTDKYGRNRDGMLFACAVATAVAAVTLDMANSPTYGGERRVVVPQPMVDGKPRADVIEAMVVEQAVMHAQNHRKQEVGTSAPPSECRACRDLTKLGFDVATDDEVGADLAKETPLDAPAVLVIQTEAQTIRGILASGGIPNGTPFGFYVGNGYDALQRATLGELQEVVLGVDLSAFNGATTA